MKNQFKFLFLTLTAAGTLFCAQKETKEQQQKQMFDPLLPVDTKSSYEARASSTGYNTFKDPEAAPLSAADFDLSKATKHAGEYMKTYEGVIYKLTKDYLNAKIEAKIAQEKASDKADIKEIIDATAKAYNESPEHFKIFKAAYAKAVGDTYEPEFIERGAQGLFKTQILQAVDDLYEKYKISGKCKI